MLACLVLGDEYVACSQVEVEVEFRRNFRSSLQALEGHVVKTDRGSALALIV